MEGSEISGENGDLEARNAVSCKNSEHTHSVCKEVWLSEMSKWLSF